MTVQLPEGASHKKIILLKENEQVKPTEHIKIVQTSPTTADIQINKATQEDEGIYRVIIDEKEQPLIHLKVLPKPVTRQILDIPQTTFNEGETLIIKCQFDSQPDEKFEFLRNEKPLVSDNRISTTVEDNTYTIAVKDLKPDEDQGVYTLKSDHLILDTPSITITRITKTEKIKETEKLVEEIDEETIVVKPIKKPEVVDIEIVEKEKDKVSSFLKSFALPFSSATIFNIHEQRNFNIVYFYSYQK
jgi:hypothetical protein